MGPGGPAEEGVSTEYQAEKIRGRHRPDGWLPLVSSANPLLIKYCVPHPSFFINMHQSNDTQDIEKVISFFNQNQ